ncbi:reverse transcriptase family protein [Sphingobacterium sp. HJSM2_6]|uniref:reverse transcriptase family protein n=1 Tax=Sphingobacterium sp. HJSM2_6 TaxID=3366264 RepID=UPI003BCA05B5
MIADFPLEDFIELAKKSRRSDDFLKNTISYINKLQSRNYPILFSLEHLAISMGVQSDYLRILIGEKKDGKPFIQNSRSLLQKKYKYFKILKKSGANRIICAPHHDLLFIQKWIYTNILINFKPANSCKGFIPNQSIKTNAEVHENADQILKIDLLRFFDTITEKRVYGAFCYLGYKNNLSVSLAKLCTIKHKSIYWNSFSEFEKAVLNDLFEKKINVLPQGAPTSPMLANIVATKMDRRFEKLSKKLNFSYSRYADDLTFSINSTAILPSIKLIRKIITEEGFFINEDKIRYIKKGKQQIVTGLSISNGVHTTKKFRKSVMRHIYFCRKFGVEEHLKKQRSKSIHINHNVISFHDWLYGNICFIKSVDKEYGEKLLFQFNKIAWFI